MSSTPQGRRVNSFDDEREVERFDLTAGNNTTGILTSVEERSSDYGGPYKYLVIDDENTGKLMGVPAWHHGLKEKLATLRPQIGERVRIRVLGETKTSGGQKFMKYDLRVDREQPTRVDYTAEAQLTTQLGDVLKFPDAPQPASPFDEAADDLPF